MNPLLSYIPDFNHIDRNGFLPAIKQGISRALAEVDTIAQNAEPPTFSNTIEALEQAGGELDRALGVYFPLLSADADEQMLEQAEEVSQLLSDYSTQVNLNRALWQRVKAVYNSPEAAALSTEQKMLLRKTFEGFERNGANLPDELRRQYADAVARLSALTTAFENNVKREMGKLRFPLQADQTGGLPQWLLERAAEQAKADGSDAPYLLTADRAIYAAFMRESTSDSLRRDFYMLFSARNGTQSEFSNVETLREIAGLRARMAEMLGRDTFAHLRLERSMALTPQGVYTLLHRLRDAYAAPARAELQRLAEFAGEEITPWNYAYHFNRLRRELHNFDEESLRPYFELNRVVDGVFGLATRLYGIRLSERHDIPVYHPDVRVFEVTDGDERLGLLYCDFFARPGRKSPGAWMTEFREANAKERPLVNIVMNFTPGMGGKPTLLTPSDVRTLLHEFGHALHALLTRAHYSSLAGTNVYRDFVELPSQFNENFLLQEEFLASFARHYQSGEPLPAEVIGRMRNAANFGAAYDCMRQLTFGYLDMAWHTLPANQLPEDAEAFELQAVEGVALFSHIPGLTISPSFSHIFAGGYAAGYYSYKWAEVLDADAFSLFEELGVFNPEAGRRFRHEILERGGTEPPHILYKRFRGRDASIDALMRRDGIIR